MKNIKTLHTDIEYYSKEDLKFNKNLNLTYELWEEISEYRETFKFEIPLLINEKENAFLTQTPWILQKEIKMISDFSSLQQSMLINLSTKYSSSTLLDDIENKSFVSDILWMINKGGKFRNISKSTIEKIVVNNEEPNTPEEKRINKIYEGLVLINKKFISPREIAKIFFGIKELNDYKLSDIHTSLIYTIKSDKISSLLTKISSIILSVKGNNMFGEKSYEVTILTLLSLIKNSYKGSMLKGISFFNTFDYFKLEIDKNLNESKKQGDLTYLTMIMISIIMYCAKISYDQIDSFIKNEIRYNSLTTRDKNKNIKQIRKNFPEISKRQADFFVSHNDPRSSYRIKDFEKYIGSSYETARYSLENLVKEGFYKKTKVGKKYVYKPIKQ